jgi:cephalosporin-C deacetylase
MPLFDLPLDELEDYLPDRREPADFDAFWAKTLDEARTHGLSPTLTRHPLPLPLVAVDEVEFAGFGGHRVGGLFLRPAHPDGPVPVVVHFLGYGDGTGSPLDWLAWPAAGCAVLVMDTRGQGARARRAGRTGDPQGSATPHVEGFLTQGVLDPHDYYYRRVFTDAVRAVEAARAMPGVDPDRVAVQGTSQGGGIALAAAALADGLAAATVNVPFLCHFRRAVEVTDSEPYAELLGFLRTHREHADRALDSLAYFDGMTMASRARVPALFSVALMDDVCPPSTVYAAYNHYAGPKELVVYPYNMHEGGGVHHDERQLTWLLGRL